MTDFTVIGGRTFLLTVGCGFVTSLMRWFDHLDNGSFTAVILGTVGAYIASSTFKAHSEVRAETQKFIAEKQTEASPPTTVEQVEK